MSKLIEAKKTFRFNVDIVKSEGSVKDEFYVEAYASTSGLDRQGDIIIQGALKKAAQDLLSVNNTVFYGHNYELANAVGRITNTEVDDVGLKVKIYVSKWAEELRTKLNEGIISKMSIGGRVVKDRDITRAEAIAQNLIDDESPFDSVKIIEEIDLFEVSFVGVPANPEAQVVGTFVKALQDFYKEVDKGGEEMKKKEKEEILQEEEKKEETLDPKVEVPEEKKELEAPKVEEQKEETKEEVIEEVKEEKEDEKKENDDVETKEEISEISEEEVQDLVNDEEPIVEETKTEEPIVEEKKTEYPDVSKELKEQKEQIDQILKAIEELKALISDKVKTIEVHTEKKSVVNTEEDKPKEEIKKTITDPDEDFLGIIKG